MRRLSPEERALWARVTRSVTATGPATEASLLSDAVEVAPGFTAAAGSQATPRYAVRRTLPSNTLDGGWDRRLATGKIVPERTLDLHGHTLATAHARLDRGLADAVRDGVRTLLLVTGRPPRAGASRLDLPLRGVIRASVGDWLAASPHRARIAAVRNAHPRHGGAGALYIILRRARDE